jgi:hypothetical protein
MNDRGYVTQCPTRLRPVRRARTIDQKAQTVTLTSDHLVAGTLKLRLEYRGDFTEDPFFTDDNGKQKDSRHAVLVGAVYTFGGRI